MDLEPSKILDYYRLRFQIEFLICDAKQHSGLEDCQARGKNKLHFHFNMSLTVVSICKKMSYSKLDNKDAPFSMFTFKRLFHNDFITQFIFLKLGIDLSCRKIKHIYNQCINIGSLDY